MDLKRSLCYIGPQIGHVIVLLYKLGFGLELPIQRRLFPIFVKLWIPVNGTQRYGIELHHIQILGHHNLVLDLRYTIT